MQMKGVFVFGSIAQKQRAVDFFHAMVGSLN